MRFLRVAPFLPLALIACGDNSDQQQPVDAHFPDSKMIDAPSNTCEYTEANDAGNDDLFGSGAAETTNLTFTTSKLTFCGKIDNTHYDSGSTLVDHDSFKVHVPSGAGVKLTMSGAGAEALNTVLIEVYDSVSGTDGVGTFLGNHAAAGVQLIPGDYVVEMSAFHTAAPTTPISYRLTLAPAELTTQCPHVTTGGYTEGHDGTNADGNDMIEVRYGSANTPHRQFTALPTDTPEDTSTGTGSFTVAPGMNYRATGINSTATVTPVSWMDSFQDRDTYAIKTGANTNEISLRLNWAATTMDFDMMVFKEATLPEFSDAYLNSNMEPEFITTAVQPNSTYWVWVGADDASTGQPVNYDLSVCGATFTP